MSICIQVSQLDKEMSEAILIARYKLGDSWERLTRVFSWSVDNPAPAYPLQVWIEQIEEDGELVDDNCISITPDQGKWFLKEFLNEPKSIWQRLTDNHE